MIVLLSLLLLISYGSFLYSQDTEEANLIAAYIERFTRFIEIKGKSDSESNRRDYVLTLFGDNKYTAQFQEVFSNQKIKNRVVKITYTDNLNDLRKSDLIFVVKASDIQIQKINDISKDNSIFTIAYLKGAAKKGIHINLFQQDKKLKFEINNNSAKEAGITISHLLLTKAVIIE
ncbi:hypothetical protein MASR1M45_05610 [Candidatus Kapaibacterium sp.]